MKKFILAPLLVLFTAMNSSHAQTDPDTAPPSPNYTEAREDMDRGEQWLISVFNWIKATVEEIKYVTVTIHELEKSPFYQGKGEDLAYLNKRKAFLRHQIQELFEESVFLTLYGEAYLNRLTDYADLKTDVFPMPTVS